MATKVKWLHVYEDGKYVGFFMERKDLDAWLKGEGKGRNVEISDVRPMDREAS